MFGLVVAGSPVLTDFEIQSDTRLLRCVGVMM